MHLNQEENTGIQKDNPAPLKTSMLNQLHRVLPTIHSIARSCPIQHRYPILKMLKELSKAFKLNQFQATFFAYMVRETKWNFKEQIIRQNSSQVDQLFYKNKHQEEYKSIVLYLVLVIFSLKNFLNEHTQQFLEEATKICKDFETVFQRWSKKHSKLTRKFSPKTLNKVYQEANFKTAQLKPNFNTLVDHILEISPPYNADLNKNKTAENDQKVRKQTMSFQTDNEQKRVNISQDCISIIKNQENRNAEINPIFSSERLNQMVEGVCVQNNMIQVSDFGGFGVNRTKNLNFNFQSSLFGSSEYSQDHNFQLKEEDPFCYELKLGLQEGQSQQNFKTGGERAADCSQNMVLSASPLNLADQYLNWKVEGHQYNY